MLSCKDNQELSAIATLCASGIQHYRHTVCIHMRAAFWQICTFAMRSRPDSQASMLQLYNLSKSVLC